MIKKYVILALAFFMLTSMIMVQSSIPKANATAPGVQPPNMYTWLIDEGAGAFPYTVDPAMCYDTASAEVIFNSMDTLIFFKGELYYEYIPFLATQVTVEPRSTTPDMNTGRVAPAYTNFTVDFKIRLDVPFQNSCRVDNPASWGNYYLTTEDVGYSLQRFLVHDFVGGATWMWFEPLLDCHVTPSASAAPPYDLANFGTKMQDAIQWNSTDVWINCANPGLATTATRSFTPGKMFTNDYGNGTYDSNFFANLASAPLDYPLKILMQVVAQSWCSILSKQWILNYVNTFPPVAGTPPETDGNPTDWNGSFTVNGPLGSMFWYDYNGWGTSPLDTILPAGISGTPGVMCGTGPYVLSTYDASAGWSSTWYYFYWQGWWWPGASWLPLNPWPWLVPHLVWPPPGFYPPFWPWSVPQSGYEQPYPPEISSGIVRGGYVTKYQVINNRNTAGRIADMQTGSVDNAAIPRSQAQNLHAGLNRNGPTLSGIRLNYPIPVLQVENENYCFIVNPTPGDTYGKINANDTLSADGIPANFFNNSDVRLAFTKLQNISFAINTLFYGEAYQPKTCAPDGLAYVNPANPMYPATPDYAGALTLLDNALFAGVKLGTVGFTVPIEYYDATGGVREAYCLNLRDAVNGLNSPPYNDGHQPYTAVSQNIPWSPFIGAINAAELATFRVGWLADYADVHDFLFPFCDSQGDYGKAQRLWLSPIQIAIDADLKSAARTPDGPARQALYYDAEAKLYTLNPTVFIMVPIGRGYQRTWDCGFGTQYDPLYPGIYAYYIWKWTYVRGDVDYSGAVNMGDIGTILNAFGSYAGKSGMPVFHLRWNFHADIDGNPYESSPAGDGGWRDRKIDMYDVSTALVFFGGKYAIAPWELHDTITPSTPTSLSHTSGHNVGTWTQTATGGDSSNYQFSWYWDNGTAITGSSSGTWGSIAISGARSQTLTITIGATWFETHESVYSRVGDGGQVAVSPHAEISIS